MPTSPTSNPSPRNRTKPHSGGFKPKRKELGERFSEGARLLWLEMLRRGCSQLQFGRVLSDAAAQLDLPAGLNRTSLVSRWLYGERKPDLVFALLMDRLFGIDPHLWAAKPIEPFVPPWAEPSTPSASPADEPTNANPEVA